jgi:DNA-binding response OmpR family regulator
MEHPTTMTILQTLTKEAETSLGRNIILERFWKRKVSSGDRTLIDDLGKLQNDIKNQIEYIKYLYEYKNEGGKPDETEEEVA